MTAPRTEDDAGLRAHVAKAILDAWEQPGQEGTKLKKTIRPYVHVQADAAIAAVRSWDEANAGSVAVAAGLEDAIANEVDDLLTALQERQIIQPFCQFHDRHHISNGEDGEFCGECAADGGIGELCHLGCDSEGIELAARALKAVAAPPAPGEAAAPVQAPVCKRCKTRAQVSGLFGHCAECNAEHVTDLQHDAEHQ